jgi:acyl CoA:acetate/3-ketoacid CoA transferase beta subunit
MIVTEKAVFDFCNEGRITLKEIAEGLSIDDISKSTGCTFETYSDIARF